MVSTRKKRQSNRRLLIQLDDFDQDVILGNTATENQKKNIVVNESTNDRSFTAGTSSNNSTINENAMNVKTPERCFNEGTDMELSNIVDTVEDRIQNEILTAIDNIVAPKTELAIRSINASSGRDAASMMTNSESGEHAGINVSFENASGNNKVQQVPYGNDVTRNDIPDEVSELSVPETLIDQQTHTHHMVTGQAAQTNQIPEFLAGCILIPCNPLSHQQQNLTIQVSQGINLPMVEQTPKTQNLDANNSINRLVDAIAGIATQQQPQAARMLKPISTNTLIFDGDNQKIELFEDLFHTMLKMQPEMTEAMKIIFLHAHLRKEPFQTFRNISASNRKTLDDLLLVFRQKSVKAESQATDKHKWHKLTFDPITKSLSDFLEELNECAERAFGANAQHMIDSLLYAKLPPHLKRSLNLVYLENGTYHQIVAHLERKLELSGLENDGELTIPTIMAVPSIDSQQNTEQAKIVCHYCKKPGHLIRECRKRKKKEQEQRNDPSLQNTEPSTSKSFSPCPHCLRTNNPPEKCWSGPNAINRAERFEQDHPADNRNDGQEQGNLTCQGPASILKNPLN